MLYGARKYNKGVIWEKGAAADDNLVPRAFPSKNGWKSPGDEVGRTNEGRESFLCPVSSRFIFVLVLSQFRGLD